MNKKMQPGIFVTATGTNIGKTVIACGIIRLLRRQSVDVGVMKPLASGSVRRKNNRWINADALRLIQSAETQDKMDWVNPYCFKNALAPGIAARLEKVSIRPQKIMAAYKNLRARHRAIIVEGAGGILVPIAKNWTVSELAKTLNLPCIVVSSSKLGTLNHTLLTVQHLRQNKIPFLGIILNFFDQRSKIDQTNLSYLKQQKIPILATVPQNSQFIRDPDLLASHLQKQLLFAQLKHILQK